MAIFAWLAAPVPRAARGGLIALVVLVALAVAVLLLAGARPGNLDDAFITLVYARHLATRGAIDWNPADGAVDGYTSALDMFLKAAALAVVPSADPLRLAGLFALLGYLGVIGAGIALVVRAADGSWRALVIAAIASLAFATNVALASATSFLLEIQLYALVVLALLGLVAFGDARAKGTRVAVGVLAVLVALARPEGVLLAALFTAWSALFAPRELPVRSRLAPLVLSFAAIGAYELWHLRLFGALAPNTFYAKSSDSRLREILDGILYLRDATRGDLVRAGMVVVAFVAPLLALARHAWASNGHRRAYALASVAALTATLEVVVEGGDGYPGWRFLAVPFTLVIATLALAAEGTRSWGALAPVAMLAAIGVSGSAKALTHLDLRIDRVRHGLEKLDDFSCERDATLWMAAHASSIAETDFQRAKLFADELTVVDLMGLNDRKRAHEHEPGRDLWGKGGFRDAAASNAEILVLGPLAPGATPMAGFTTRTVVDSPRLSKELLGQPFPPETRDDLVSHYVTASIPRTCGGYLNVFVRADRAADLARGGAIVGRAE